MKETGKDVLPAKISLQGYEVKADHIATEVSGKAIKRRMVLELSKVDTYRENEHERVELPRSVMAVVIPKGYDEGFVSQLAQKLGEKAPENGFGSLEKLEKAVAASAGEIFQGEPEITRMPVNRLARHQ